MSENLRTRGGPGEARPEEVKMDSHLLVTLEDVVEKWMNDHCEDDEWPQSYVYEYQSRDMAKAAELVFDASTKGQEYLKINES